jgi:hypothetical protein
VKKEKMEMKKEMLTLAICAVLLVLVFFSGTALTALAFEECQYATSVVSVNRGTPNDGSFGGNPSDVLGPPNFLNDPNGDGVTFYTYFNLGIGGDITVRFDKPFKNGPGADIFVYETSGGVNYPEYVTITLLSSTGADITLGPSQWSTVGTRLNPDGGIASLYKFEFDIPLDQAGAFEKLRVNDNSLAQNSNGADIDAIGALYFAQTPEITITTPSNLGEEILKGTKVLIQGTAQGVDHVDIWIFREETEKESKKGKADWIDDKSFQYYWDTSGTFAGKYKIIAKGMDKAGTQVFSDGEPVKDDVPVIIYEPKLTFTIIDGSGWLTLHEGSSENPWVARSGDNKPAHQNWEDHGPIPKGEWEVGKRQYLPGEPPEGLYGWALPLSEVNVYNPSERGHFWIHGGPWRPTKGCIRLHDSHLNVLIDKLDSENGIRKTYKGPLYLDVVYQIIPATIDLDLDTLNLHSKGKWVTTYVELPEDYDASNIDVSTIRLNDEVQVEDNPTEIGDYDGDGIADLMVKFDRSAVQEILEVGDEVGITVTGELTDGTPFGGSDTIRVIDKGKSK